MPFIHPFQRDDVALDLARTLVRSATEAPPRGSVERLHGEFLAGDWAVVDSFDECGCRCVMFRRAERAASGSRGALTRRQREIATFAARGHSNKQIAYEMGISESTVSEHVRRAVSKLGLRSRVELVSTLAALSAVASTTAP
ncbi:MAG TPA: helix-turn-helix transcriptional regulator [Polyangiaceae bacterium]|nr:helix-turn-helix transcriptional regulator [Polyangiaceae bacterium]